MIQTTLQTTIRDLSYLMSLASEDKTRDIIRELKENLAKTLNHSTVNPEQKYKIEILDDGEPEHWQPADYKAAFYKDRPRRSWYKVTGAHATNAAWSNRTEAEFEADHVERQVAIAICRDHPLATRCHPPLILIETY